MEPATPDDVVIGIRLVAAASRLGTMGTSTQALSMSFALLILTPVKSGS